MITVYCDASECKYNKDGECERSYDYVNLNKDAKCEDFEDKEQTE